jgi:hypothetical protein
MIEFESEHGGFAVEDYIDSDGEVELETRNNSNYDISVYIDKEAAIKLIAHLSKLFSLEGK